MIYLISESKQAGLHAVYVLRTAATYLYMHVERRIADARVLSLTCTHMHAHSTELRMPSEFVVNATTPATSGRIEATCQPDLTVSSSDCRRRQTTCPRCVVRCCMGGLLVGAVPGTSELHAAHCLANPTVCGSVHGACYGAVQGLAAFCSQDRNFGKEKLAPLDRNACE